MQFYLPEVKWQAPQGSSFDTIVRGLQRVILANPFLAQKHKWPTETRAIEDWVDLYNATICAKMGWNHYILDESGPVSVPKAQAPQHLANLQSLRDVAGAVKEIISGAQSLGEWIDSGEPPVERAAAELRALICVACPQNSPGDFTKWFTIPAAELIRRHIQKAQDRNLATLSDDRLNLCLACHCPLKLKVHVPLPWIAKRLTDSQKARLAEGKSCWILSELSKSPVPLFLEA
jgi:hypothetical protein